MWSQWRKSSRSNGTGNCVELSVAPGSVRVRDSKNAAGRVLGFSAVAMAAFLAAVADERPA